MIANAASLKGKIRNLAKDTASIMHIIRDSDELQKQWKNYQREYQYAKSITFMDTIQAVQKLL